MNMREILELAKRGRPELAAMNLGASGYSPLALRRISQHAHVSGTQFSQKALYSLYQQYRRGL